MENLDSDTLIVESCRNDPQPCQLLLPLRRVPRKPWQETEEIRDEFSEYVISDVGQVPWQLQLA